MNNQNNTIGLETLERVIGRNKFQPFNYELDAASDFILYKEAHEEFISPLFSVLQKINCDKWTESQVILIAAVGASGKSWLSDQLSYDLKCPKIDLGKMSVVASYSLTGIINRKLGVKYAGEYMVALQQGEKGLVIDALDEGYQKTNTNGYFDFLDDVISMLPNSSHKGTIPIILLGRINAVELAALHLSEKGCSVAILTIEPFTIEKAKTFIDKRIGKDKSYDKKYQEIRDYIIDSIGCFFKNQSEINLQRARFIGYAPVLLAISDYINGINNYHKEINSLKSSNKQSVFLIIDIIERILKRDKKEKIDELLLKDIVKHRDEDFQNKVLSEVYRSEEQCARVLYFMLNRQYNFSLIDDEDFKSRYEKNICEWIQEHPFLNGRKPANIVFESYILSKLAMMSQYKKDVYDYLSTSYNNSYIFFHIFNALHRGKTIELPIVPYLYESLEALEDKECKYSFELFLDEKMDDGSMLLEANFDNEIIEETEDYQYSVIAYEDEEFKIGAYLSNANIDIPISVSFCAHRTELTSPVYVSCKSLIVRSEEIITNSRGEKNETGIVIETNEITTQTEKGILPDIKSFGERTKLMIVCMDELSYPFLNYQSKNALSGLKDLSYEEKEYYMKMRRLIIMFRSHSKGELAKYYMKIDKRIGRKEYGKPVLEALLNKHIIYKKGVMYYIDSKAMNKHLGVSFDGIKEGIINDKIKNFISSI